MKPRYRQLYEELLTELEKIKSSGLEEDEYVAAAFWMANDYWNKLKLIVFPFTDDLDEIDFFKKVKPAFTSWIEYFTIVCESLICVPKNEIDARTYWKEEEKRYPLFYERNKEFVDYYENGCRSNDVIYFLRRNANPANVVQAPVYDVEPEFTTACDHQVRTYLAKKMYSEYCHSKICLLTK